MPAFGSGLWPSNYGPIPYVNTQTAGGSTSFQAVAKKTAITTPTTTGVGAGTEGTDLFTFTVPSAGLYRISAYIAVNTNSDAGTSDAVSPVATWTDDIGAQTNKPFYAGTQTLDAKGASNLVAGWVGCVRVAAAGTIALKVNSTVTGTKTVGKVNFAGTVEFIGE